jgi:hypothetical protein
MNTLRFGRGPENTDPRREDDRENDGKRHREEWIQHPERHFDENDETTTEYHQPTDLPKSPTRKFPSPISSKRPCTRKAAGITVPSCFYVDTDPNVVLVPWVLN